MSGTGPEPFCPKIMTQTRTGLELAVKLINDLVENKLHKIFKF